MSMRVFNWLATLGLVLVLWFLPSLALGGEWQDEAEAKAGVQEVAPPQAQAAMKDAAKIEAVEGLDEDVVEGQVMLANPFGFEPEKMKAAKRFQLTQLFQVEVELIQRLCNPTPQQLTKLRVGSKGAVKKLTDQWWEKAGGQFGGMMRPGAEDGDKEAEDAEETAETESEDIESVEIKDADEIDSNMAQFVMTDQMGNPFKAKSPQQETIWTNLVAGILTAEQSKTLADYKAKQDKQRRVDLLDSVLSTLTRELSLTAEQQTKLREILHPQIAEARLTSLPIFETYVGYYYASKATNEDLADVLSPAQIQSFRVFLLPVREIGAMMEMEANDD